MVRIARHPLVLLTIAGLIVHVGVLAAARARTGQIDGYAFASLDAREYYQLAENLLEHGRFSLAEHPPLVPDTWRTPGYPLFLAAVRLVAGPDPARLVCTQQLLAIANVLLVYGIARRTLTQRRAAGAALLCLVEPYHLFYSLWLLATTWFVTLILLTWLAWISAQRRQRWLDWALAGALIGLTVLTRPVAILFPAALLMGLLHLTVAAWRAPRPPRARGTSTRAVVCFGLAAAGVVGAWMARNRLVADHFALSSQGGAVLAYFKATECVLWRQGRTQDRYRETSLNPEAADAPHTIWDDIDNELRAAFDHAPPDRLEQLKWPNLAQGNRTDFDAFAVSQQLTRVGRRYLLESPLSTTLCCLVRCGSILTFPLNLALRPPTGQEVHRARSAAVGVLYLVLAAAVAARLATARWRWVDAFFPAACLLALLITTTPQIDPRFRVPMIPLLVFLVMLPRRPRSHPPEPAPAGPDDQNAMSNVE